MRIFNVASYKRPDTLINTLKSIKDQADVINVALNHYGEIPKGFVDHPNINWYPTDNSIGDGFKFYQLENSDGYFFTIDDDLIYPPNYADIMIYNYNKYKCVVTLHGRNFAGFPVASYYNSAASYYPCLGDVPNDVKVQVGGTGVMMFRTDLLKFSYTDIKSANMADIWMSKFAKEKGVDIVCLAHKKGWLQYQEVPNTIWDEHHMNDSEQTKLINSIWT